MKTLMLAAACSFGALAPAALFPARAVAQHEEVSLTVGDQAPPLYISKWLKGEPVDGFENGEVYVVEFWATWCGPCIAGMPHLSDLQKKHEGEVTIIGVNIFERDTEAVPGWMEDRGDQPSGNELMQYTVAMEEGTKMADEWMRRAGRNGIPSAFIVDRDGTIAWIGHPASMDDPLERVVEGTWDTRAAAERHAEERRAQRERQREMIEFQQRAGDAMTRFGDASKPQDLMDAAEDLLAADPPESMGAAIVGSAFVRLAQMDAADKAYTLVKHHKDMVWGQSAQLNSLSWQILTHPAFDGQRDAEMALMLGERAHELVDGEDAPIADTVARAYFLKAIELQRKAVEMADQSMRPSLERQLEIYEEAYDKQPE